MGVSVEGTTCAHAVGEATRNIFSFGNKPSDKRILSSDPPASACPETSLAIVCDRRPQTLGLGGGEDVPWGPTAALRGWALWRDLWAASARLLHP